MRGAEHNNNDRQNILIVPKIPIWREVNPLSEGDVTCSGCSISYRQNH